MEKERRTGFVAVAFAAGEGSTLAALRRGVEEAAPPRTRVARVRGGIVVGLCETSGPVESRELADAWRARMAPVLGDVAVSIGVSDARRSAHAAILHAEQALLVGRALRGEGRTTAFGDLGPYCFVLGQPVEDIRAFCQRVLGPLANASGGRQEDLVRTLEAYLRAHGSVNGVARALYLHRNTVRQRLRRVAKVTGADLNDADSRLSLHLALLGRQALAHFGNASS